MTSSYPISLTHPLIHTLSPSIFVPFHLYKLIGIPGVYSDFQLSDLARSVADRQTAAKQSVPHYYLSVELNLSKLMALREELNRGGGKEGDVSVLDMMVKASALAMKQVSPLAHTLMLRTHIDHMYAHSHALQSFRTWTTLISLIFLIYVLSFLFLLSFCEGS